MFEARCSFCQRGCEMGIQLCPSILRGVLKRSVKPVKALLIVPHQALTQKWKRMLQNCKTQT